MAVAGAEFQLVDGAPDGFEPGLFGYEPSCGDGGEEAVAVSLRKVGRTVKTHGKAEHILVRPGLVRPEVEGIHRVLVHVGFRLDLLGAGSEIIVLEDVRGNLLGAHLCVFEVIVVPGSSEHEVRFEPSVEEVPVVGEVVFVRPAHSVTVGNVRLVAGGAFRPVDQSFLAVVGYFCIVELDVPVHVEVQSVDDMEGKPHVAEYVGILVENLEVLKLLDGVGCGLGERIIALASPGAVGVFDGDDRRHLVDVSDGSLHHSPFLVGAVVLGFGQ